MSGQPLVEPTVLREGFELVTGIYSRAAIGKTLVDWLSEDWAMFRRLDSANAKVLLADILDDGEIVRQNFVPSPMCHSDSLDRWDRLRSELMHENRFFPRIALDLERLEGLLPYLLVDISELPQTWFRARIQQESRPYAADEMGAPPKHRATHGRANPAGIPYLYLASTVLTAISELRPHPGEAATVAEFSIAAGLKLVDLRSPRITVSTFMLSSESAVALVRGDIGFLEHLGNELTRPVVPQTAAIDYIPAQFLCEFVKHSGFDGVAYKSSVGEGVNVALFQPELATIGRLVTRRVSSVAVELSEN